MDDIKKLIFPFLGVALFVVFVGFLYNKEKFKLPFTKKAAPPGEIKKTVDVKITGTDIVIKAILANNEASRKKGLGGVDKLAENEGMLFVFDKPDIIPSFWMKDMLITIDILWIKEDKITQIHNNIQPPGKDTADKNLTKYIPDKSIDYALELNAGFADKYGLKEGDSVEIPDLR